MMQKRFDIPRKLLSREELLQPGILSCQGCGGAIAMKLALKGLGRRTMTVLPACCMSIIAGVWPNTAMGVPVLHVPFATGAVAASGVRAALDVRGEQDVVVMTWAGDGGTYDIGLQSLSGAAERNENILYVCYDNEAYMNTGVQRSSATPPGAWTTTTPEGALKSEPKKDLEKIMLAHHIPYLATASIAYPDDLVAKFRKARGIRGLRFIHLLSPCPPGWQTDPGHSVRISRRAVQSNVFPLYEVEAGRWRINVIPEPRLPVTAYLEDQGRFRRMPAEMIRRMQTEADRRWEELLAAAGAPTP
jgi:pyruvate ferredoxin oxidoreductase beta subunit/2-oxoisovalerate ferredoxin oxidoreductase beta subunit